MSDSTRTRAGSAALDLPALDVASMRDQKLVDCVAAGRAEALAEVLARHGAVMSAVACRAVGESGCDIVQDVVTRLWQSPGRFDASRGPLRSFLILQVRSRAVDVLRTDASRRVREERNEHSERRT